MKLSAVIFDLDGTIINSEEAWGKSFTKVLESFGVKVDSPHSHTTGVSVKDNWLNLIKKYNIKTNKTLEELETLTYFEYEKLISIVKLNAGVLEFMEEIKKSGIPLALTTSTNLKTVNKILERFEIRDFFEMVTTGEEVESPKPDPGIYILTADKLGVEREDCLVIEDSESGIKAAEEAGMKVIKITEDNGFSDIKLKEIMLLF